MIKDKSSKGLRQLVASRRAASSEDDLFAADINLREVGEILIALTERVEALEMDKWPEKKP